jgi:tetratricopeptide (TPR) repeat protein
MNRDEAIERFHKALNADENQFNALYGMGYVWEAKGDSDKAIEYYCRVLEAPNIDDRTRQELDDRVMILEGSCD